MNCIRSEFFCNNKIFFFFKGPASAANAKKQKTKKGNNKKSSQRSAKKKLPQVANDLSDKLYQIMEKHKEVRFVLLFN